MAGSIMLSVTYGYEVTTANDRLVNIVKTAVYGISQAAIPSSKFRYVPINREVTEANEEF